MYPLDNGYVTDRSFAPLIDSVNYKVVSLNGQLELKNQMVPFETQVVFPMGRNRNSFKTHNQGLIFHGIYGDTTYKVSPEGASPLLQIDFGEKYLWKDKSLMKNQLAVMMVIPEGKGVWDYNPFVGEDHIYLIYSLSLKQLATVIDRKTGAYQILNTFISPEERYDLSPIAWDGDRLMFSLPSTSVSSLIDELQEGQWKFKADTSLEKIESSENPVFVWIKFKDIVN